MIRELKNQFRQGEVIYHWQTRLKLTQALPLPLLIRAQIELTSNLFNSCFVPFDRLSTVVVELANFIRPKKGIQLHSGVSFSCILVSLFMYTQLYCKVRNQKIK